MMGVSETISSIYVSGDSEALTVWHNRVDTERAVDNDGPKIKEILF